MRHLTVEGVMSLNPDLILVTSDAKPNHALDRLQASGVKVEVIENQPSLEGVLHKIDRIAEIFGVRDLGDKLKHQVNQDVLQVMQMIQKEVGKLTQSPQGLFVLAVRNGNLSVAGQGSRANALIKMIGLSNPLENQVRNYQPLSAEAAIQINPDFVLMLEQGVSMSGGISAVLNNPVLQHTQAFKQQALIVMPNDVLNFGPRLGQMISQVYQQWSGMAIHAPDALQQTANNGND
jgi:iron complex transport system substrate-binding protein